MAHDKLYSLDELQDMFPGLWSSAAAPGELFYNVIIDNSQTKFIFQMKDGSFTTVSKTPIFKKTDNLSLKEVATFHKKYWKMKNFI